VPERWGMLLQEVRAAVQRAQEAAAGLPRAGPADSVAPFPLSVRVVKLATLGLVEKEAW